MRDLYNLFFRELMEFSNALLWSTKDSFAGAAEEDLKIFEQNNKIVLGHGFYSYLKHFGYRVDSKFLSINFGFDRMKSLVELEYEMKEESKKFDKTMSWVDRIHECEMRKSGSTEKVGVPIIIGEVIESGIVLYVLSNDEYFYVRSYSLDSNKIDSGTLFRTIFRRNLYQSLMYKPKYNVADINRYNMYFNEAIVNRIPWLKYYRALSEEFPKKVISRYKFHSIATSIELKEERIMGIDEFETECIKFLIEEEGFIWKPDVFDPYAPLVTFKKYFLDDDF